MTNDNVLLITFGEPGDGLTNFTITGRDWNKLEEWIKAFGIDYCFGVNSFSWYKVAEQMTPHQLKKFPSLYNKKEAEEFIIEYIGKEAWLECLMHRAKALIEERRRRVLSGEFGTPNEEGTMVMCMGQWTEPMIV
tara:strand:- start:82 stop:486 length:405 start_codon:yes stop_codon:yes gene_type:complete